MKKKVLICGLLAITLILSACSAKKTASSGSTANSAAPMHQAANDSIGISNGASAGAASTADASANTKDAAAVQTTVQLDAEKKIITNASMYIVEDDLNKLSQAIQQKAEELGGYVENENVSEERISATVRIPSDKFESFMSYTEKGFDVKSKSISSQNITDAYVDNDARLRNLIAQEDQVLTILKKANTVEEVLKVQDELFKIRGDAEALEAKKKSWDKQVDYATVNINADKKVIVPENKKSIIGGSDFLKSIGKGFSNTSVSLVLAVEHFLIFVFSNIIIILILLAAGIFGYKKYKKYLKNNNNK